MMSQETQCRLCLNTGDFYKNLYNTNGHCDTDAFEIVSKYFHPIFLSVLNGSLSVICSKCWYIITEFHNFRQTIFKAQAELLRTAAKTLKERKAKSLKQKKPAIRSDDEDTIMFVTENAVTKDAFVNIACETSLPGGYTIKQYENAMKSLAGIPQQMPTNSFMFNSINKLNNEKLITISNIETCSQPVLNNHDNSISYISSDDEYDSDVEEYEPEIGVFIGGEFGNVAANAKQKDCSKTQSMDQSKADSMKQSMARNDNNSKSHYYNTNLKETEINSLTRHTSSPKVYNKDCTYIETSKTQRRFEFAADNGSYNNSIVSENYSDTIVKKTAAKESPIHIIDVKSIWPTINLKASCATSSLKQVTTEEATKRNLEFETESSATNIENPNKKLKNILNM